MKYAPEDLKRLHEVQVEILSEVIRVCKENDITYFTVGGTTLGAVRHNGFIPWDDDIDIGMLRPDYDKFIEIAPQMLKKGFVLQHFTTDKNSVAFFAKVRKDNTVFLEENMKHVNMHHGIFIDIMPQDFVPMEKKARERHNIMVRICDHLFLAKTLWTPAAAYVPNKFIGVASTLIRSMLHILLLPVPKACLYKMGDRVMRKYLGSNTTMTSSRGYNCFNCDISDLIPVAKHPFESITVNLPGNTDKVLRIQYGEYMKLPPEDRRFNHAPVELKFET